MLRINVLSDLHLEHYPQNKLPDYKLSDNLDVLVLAGDIFKGSKKGILDYYQNWLLNIAKKAKYVIYVIGNHELYGTRKDKFIQSFKNFTKGTNIYLLENNSLIIDNYKFIGATLWTDFQYPDMPIFKDLRKISTTNNGFWAEKKMNDFKKITQKISNQYRKLRYYNVMEFYIESKNFILSELNKDDGCNNIVVTHFSAIKEALKEDEKKEYAMYYVNDLEQNFLNTVNPPKLLIAGHSHIVKHEKINEHFDLIMNCAGYQGDVLNFKSDKLILC